MVWKIGIGTMITGVMSNEYIVVGAESRTIYHNQDGTTDAAESCKISQLSDHVFFFASVRTNVTVNGYVLEST